MGEIKKQYAYHHVTDEVAARVVRLRKAASELDTLIRESSPTCREQSLAFTKLEEMVHWAAKAITHTHPTSIPETGEDAS